MICFVNIWVHYCPEEGTGHLNVCQLQWLWEGSCPLYQSGAFDIIVYNLVLSILPSWFWCHHMSLLIRPFLYGLFIPSLFCWHLLSCLAHKCGCVPGLYLWAHFLSNHCLQMTLSGPRLVALACQWPPTYSSSADPSPGPQAHVASTHMTWRTDTPCPNGQTSQTRAVESSALPPPLDVFHLGSSSDWMKT